MEKEVTFKEACLLGSLSIRTDEVRFYKSE